MLFSSETLEDELSTATALPAAWSTVLLRTWALAGLVEEDTVL